MYHAVNNFFMFDIRFKLRKQTLCKQDEQLLIFLAREEYFDHA